ncbi:hypothetical protein BJ912DRAFT_1147030 [Pholiota molesta]|nr:hypothetical protein BJ912DRAFT_1147030 [Pholiota molesta]
MINARRRDDSAQHTTERRHVITTSGWRTRYANAIRWTAGAPQRMRRARGWRVVAIPSKDCRQTIVPTTRVPHAGWTNPAHPNAHPASHSQPRPSAHPSAQAAASHAAVHSANHAHGASMQHLSAFVAGHPSPTLLKPIIDALFDAISADAAPGAFSHDPHAPVPLELCRRVRILPRHMGIAGPRALQIAPGRGWIHARGRGVNSGDVNDGRGSRVSNARSITIPSRRTRKPAICRVLWRRDAT